MPPRPPHPAPRPPPAAPVPPAGDAPAGDAPDYPALAAFRHALRGFTAFSEAQAHAAGLTPRQHQALLAIKGGAGAERVSVGDLARQLLIRPHSTGELVDRLVQLGLVERQEDPEDHRRALLRLTARAEAILHELSAAHLRELRAVRPTLLALLRRFGPSGPEAE